MVEFFFLSRWKQSTTKVFFQAVFAVSLFSCLVTFAGYVMSYQYTPENHHSIFQMMRDMKNVKNVKDMSSQKIASKKVLFCTMISNDFDAYSIGAIKLGQAIHKDMPLLQGSNMNLFVETAIVELKERPISLKVWVKLRDEGGWQKKILFHRLPPRNEGKEFSSRFQDQFTKLKLWTMDQQGFDWVVYMDSDMFVVRSLVPMFEHIIVLDTQQNMLSKKIWAVRDFPEFADAFNMGLFAIQPNSTEFERLKCLLYGNCKGIFPIQFSETWAEQGFLNAVYENQWSEIPWIYGMNLATWNFRKDVWDANASHIQAIHFTMVKPWNWWCSWTQYAPLCYLFWHRDNMRFHKVD